MHSSCGQNRSECLNTAEEAVLELAAAVPACSPSDSMHAVQFGGRLLETYSADCFCCPPMILKPQTKFAPPERITLSAADSYPSGPAGGYSTPGPRPLISAEAGTRLWWLPAFGRHTHK